MTCQHDEWYINGFNSKNPNKSTQAKTIASHMIITEYFPFFALKILKCWKWCKSKVFFNEKQ